MGTQRTTRTTERSRIATALWVIAMLAGLIAALLAHPGARESMDRLDMPLHHEAASSLDEPPADTDIVRW